MRTLLYFRTHFDDPSNTGVTDKCKAIIRYFGTDGDAWFFTKDGLSNENHPNNSFHLNTPKYSFKHLLLFYFIADFWLMRKVNFKEYQLFYIRHLPVHPLFLWLLKTAKKQNPNLKIVIELPTWPYDFEVKGMNAKMASFIDRLFRKKLVTHTDHFIHYGVEKEIWGIPTIPMSNGVEVLKKPIIQKNTHSDGILRLLAIGTWHFSLGLERILEGMAQYINQNGKVHLTVLGQGASIESLKNLTQKLNLGENVAFHPPCTGPVFDNFFNNADLAIGKLGIHQVGFSVTSSLRHRDYCSRGIPFILSGEDSDIDENWPFVLRFPADDSPIDISLLVNYLSELKEKHPDYTKEIRIFALENLDWSVKMQQFVDALNF
jgi:glycosyltransferase involved in cell wall biosynthesis